MLRDYPTTSSGRPQGEQNAWAQERGAFEKMASRHLTRFARWYETGKCRNWSIELAASVYCLTRNLPNRFALHQTLGQLYEQQAIQEYNPYPPHFRAKARIFGIPLSSISRRGPPAPALS